MTAHSRFGGSSASRWMSCPGSVALLQTVPAKGSSAYAEEGTLAHAFAAYMLASGDRSAASYIGATLDAQVGAKPLAEEMAVAIQVYLDAVRAEYDRTPDAELFVEKSFELAVESAEPGEVFGTNDAMVYHPSTGRLVVFDYKHGVGVSVSAEDNAQLKFYAAGAVFSNEWKLSEVVLTIVQPRARDADEIGAVREWVFDTVELLEFKAEVGAAIARAKVVWEVGVDTRHLRTGSWCRWCDAAAVCPAKQSEALQDLDLAFGDVAEITTDDLPDPRTLVPERLSKVVAGIGLLSAWANQCQEYLEALLLGGTAVPGWKVVEKIGRAKWVSDEEQIASALTMLYDVPEDLVRPRRLTTIGDVEKLMKAAGAPKSEIENFKLANTIKESSGLTIAPDSDRRPAIDAAARAFGDVEIQAPREE